MPHHGEPRGLPDQSGRTFVVTGASGGLGRQVATTLAAAGGHVIAGVRSVQRGRAALDDAAGEIEVRRLDLASLASVAEFAAGIDGCDVLVNNAGVMATPYARTEDGFELQIGTNHLGHAALALALLPRIRDRVVVVASTAHRHAGLDLTDLHWTRRTYRPYRAYAASKLANLLFLAELQRRLTADGSVLRAMGAHPGYTSTGITAHTGSRVFDRISGLGNALVGMPVEQGALSILHAATSDIPGNSYLGPGRLGQLRGTPTMVGRSPAASDPELARALWARTGELIGLSRG